jgi:hypothetical protein
MFPHGKYDDQVDSTSQALDWAKEGSQCLGVVEYNKREAQKLGFRLPLDSPQNQMAEYHKKYNRKTMLRNRFW